MRAQNLRSLASIHILLVSFMDSCQLMFLLNIASMLLFSDLFIFYLYRLLTDFSSLKKIESVSPSFYSSFVK